MKLCNDYTHKANDMDNTVQPRNAGRRFFPSVIVDQIIEKVEQGKSISEICENPAFPSRKTFYNWLTEDPDLYARYVAAVRKQVLSRTDK
jgi:hypothetical protein